MTALRDAGLAHVLAISGLHMAVLAGGIFWFVRLILAAFPAVALRLPIKPIAALVALAAAGFYLLVSGASLATQRACIMLALMFLAVMLGRPALSLRNVALAALAILTWTPHAVLDVGFQMSFAAVSGLVAAYEALRGSPDGQSRNDRLQRPSLLAEFPRPLSLAIRFIVGIALTTIVASIAVAPLAAYHFHKLAQFSLLGNLLVVPVVTLVVMPLTLLVVLSIPFGLEGYVLSLLLAPIAWSLDTATWVASWPNAVRAVPQMWQVSMLAIVSGGLWLIIMRRGWRILGLALIAAA